MSTIVCQELQPSCNIESKTLSLKLNSSTTPSNSNNCSGWSYIEALPSKSDILVKDKPIYVHPLVRRSTFMLNEKSLEMCTESLGCETGTCDMVSCDSFFPPTPSPPPPPSTTTTTTTKERNPRQKFDTRKELSSHGKFPPPLTTISGTSPISVRPYREDGRLVIEAVSTPPIQSYMQVERSDGRLKLSMLTRKVSNKLDTEEDNDEDEDNSIAIASTQNSDSNEAEDVLENNEEAKEKEVEEDVEKEGLEECNKSDGYWLEDMNGRKVELGVKLEMGKIQRPSRCKERGHRLINWEPFWVAT